MSIQTNAKSVDVLEAMRHAADDCLDTSNSRRDVLAGIALTDARAAVAELFAAVRPHVALTFAEGAAADADGRSLIYCKADKLSPCWSEGTPYTGKHWGWTPDADGEFPVCEECCLRAALAACGVKP